MGTVKYLATVEELFNKTPVLDINSLKRKIPASLEYLRLLLHQLIKKKKIYRWTRGFYSKLQDPSLAVFCFKPAYLGLQEALSIHNLWEQETNTIILTGKKVRVGLRDINDNKIILKRLPARLIFGIEYKQYGDFYLPVSDLEKTLLDLIYFKQSLEPKLIKEFKKRIDTKKLRKYLKSYDPEIKAQVKVLRLF